MIYTQEELGYGGSSSFATVVVAGAQALFGGVSLKESYHSRSYFSDSRWVFNMVPLTFSLKLLATAGIVPNRTLGPV
jgi:hypothetical protein